MKAIGIKMVDLVPMTAKEAREKGYRTNGYLTNAPGYEVTYGNGYKSWTPANVAKGAYYILDKDSDGTKILESDVTDFITDIEVAKFGEKTTVVNFHTLTGFDCVEHSSCVCPENYDEKLGVEYAKEKVISKLWGHLGFVLQWAKYGLNRDRNRENG